MCSYIYELCIESFASKKDSAEYHLLAHLKVRITARKGDAEREKRLPPTGSLPK